VSGHCRLEPGACCGPWLGGVAVKLGLVMVLPVLLVVVWVEVLLDPLAVVQYLLIHHLPTMSIMSTISTMSTIFIKILNQHSC
jgi:hypothetical protein